MNTTEATQAQKKKRPIEEARERLKLLSLEVKDMVEAGMFFTINDAIMETLYKDEQHREFKSYRQWKKDGKQVRKGEKAYLLWARPKDIERRMEKDGEENLDDMIQFYPIAYLFSNAQVDDMAGKHVESQAEKVDATLILEPLKEY